MLEKQAATLRKRTDTAEEQSAHLRASNQALLSSLPDTASKTAAHLASTEHSGRSDSYVAELRAKDTQIGLLRNSIAETVEQLTLMRDLLTVFLEPSPEALAAPERLSQEHSPEQWRIVFVGGHQRLHSKLRKQMRNAVFLHPDQSHFAPETFKGADAVIFSIGYCSHALIYRAADEVRRHGLRAGYSNFTNVEMVLDEILAVLFPNGENPDRKAA